MLRHGNFHIIDSVFFNWCCAGLEHKNLKVTQTAILLMNPDPMNDTFCCNITVWMETVYAPCELAYLQSG